MIDLLKTEVDQALRAAKAARGRWDRESAWKLLERAHIVSQPMLGPHLRVHVAMLGQAIADGDVREVAGQALRLALAPLGHMTGRIPWGNIGRATVSAFEPMPLPDDIAALYAAAGIEVRR